MSRLLPTGTTMPLPDVGKDFPYYEVLLHYVSSFSDGRRQSAVRICDRARRRFRGARGLPGRCAWARGGRCGAGPAGWTRRLAQPQQLTGKLFTSFRGPKFPDSGVVWGGAAWFPEYPERSEELANPQLMEVDREDQTAARHQSRHGNRQRNRAGGTRGCALRPRLSARRIDPDATASAGDRPATARGGQGTAVQH